MRTTNNAAHFNPLIRPHNEMIIIMVAIFDLVSLLCACILWLTKAKQGICEEPTWTGGTKNRGPLFMGQTNVRFSSQPTTGSTTIYLFTLPVEAASIINTTVLLTIMTTLSTMYHKLLISCKCDIICITTCINQAV